MLIYAAAFISAVISATTVQKRTWMLDRSQDCWERIVMGTFTDEDLLSSSVSNLGMRRQTFDFICGRLWPVSSRRDTVTLTVGEEGRGDHSVPSNRLGIQQFITAIWHEQNNHLYLSFVWFVVF